MEIVIIKLLHQLVDRMVLGIGPRAERELRTGSVAVIKPPKKIRAGA